MAQRLAELVLAFGLLTRLPLPRAMIPDEPADPAAAVWAYPVAGAVVGGLSAIAYGLAAWIGLPPGLAGVIAIAVLVLTTGALHEDGLADAADGFGGGRDREAKLAIMRDSRIGSYGVIALILLFALRLGALAALADWGAVAAALIAAGALSRGALPPLMHLMPHARADGLSVSVGRPDGRPVAEALAAAILLAFLVLSPGGALAAILVVALSTILCAWIAHRQIGGQTGDVLGATAMLAEAAVLLALVAIA